jgi:signal transduction histidine kinase
MKSQNIRKFLGWLSRLVTIIPDRFRQAAQAQHDNIIHQERRRIAIDIHDGLGTQFTLIRFRLGKLKNQLCDLQATLPQGIIETLEKLEEDVTFCIKETDFFIWNLQIKGGRDGLIGLLDYLAHNLDDKLEFDSIVETEQNFPQFDITTNTQISRIISEAVSNVLKHSGTRKLTVSLLAQPPDFVIKIIDYGSGFDASKIIKGQGIPNMSERANFIGGRISFDSVLGKGTTIIVSIPLKKTTMG